MKLTNPFLLLFLCLLLAPCAADARTYRQQIRVAEVVPDPESPEWPIRDRFGWSYRFADPDLQASDWLSYYALYRKRSDPDAYYICMWKDPIVFGELPPHLLKTFLEQVNTAK